MERVKRFAGLAKAAPAGPIRRDEDESLVLFGELYRHEKEKDVNLLEPMFSVEFEAIQGDGRMFKLPSGKRDYILPDGDKNDYDWLKTPPATPLFPSLEMEANSSQMIFQKELPILQPVKTSRFWSKPDSISSTSTRSESPTSSSSKSVTPTAARPGSSSSKKSLAKAAAPAASKEQDSSYRIDKRSSYTPLTLPNRQHTTAAPAGARSANKATAVKAPKKASGNKTAGSDNKDAVKSVAKVDNKAPTKHVAATAPKVRSNDSAAAGVKILKGDVGTARRLSRPPPATIGSNGEGVQDTVATKGKGGAGAGTGAGAVLVTSKSAGSSEAVAKGRRRAGGEKEQRPKLGSHAKK